LKTLLLVLVLGLGVWSAPAWSVPLREGNARDDAKHADLSFGSKDAAGKNPKAHAKSDKWLDGRLGSIAHRSDSTGAAPAVPEPAGLMLFGVGFLITRRALARARA
jgi:hypothetical protein